MLSGQAGRKAAAVVVEPLARGFLNLGLTPNVVTVAGTVVAIGISATLIPGGHLVTAALLTALFAAFDMLDGTMARMTTGGSKFGATLDASCDRLTDGALFAAIIYWMVYTDHSHPVHVVAALIVLISSQVISYVKARGEASGFEMSGGLIERPERLIIGLGGLALEGVGVPYALEVSLWILVVGSLFTIAQRLAKAAGQDTKARYLAA